MKKFIYFILDGQTPSQSLKVSDYDITQEHNLTFLNRIASIPKNSSPFEAISEVLWFHSFYGSKLVSL